MFCMLGGPGGMFCMLGAPVIFGGPDELAGGIVPGGPIGIPCPMEPGGGGIGGKLGIPGGGGTIDPIDPLLLEGGPVPGGPSIVFY